MAQRLREAAHAFEADARGRAIDAVAEWYVAAMNGDIPNPPEDLLTELPLAAASTDSPLAQVALTAVKKILDNCRQSEFGDNFRFCLAEAGEPCGA